MVNNGNTWDGDLVLPSQVIYEDKTYTVTTIEWLAFTGCETLTRVHIPATISMIQHYAGFEDCKNPFYGCKNLKAIDVDPENKWMCSVDGVLFNKEKTQLWCFPAAAKIEKYDVPKSVTWIGGDAFSGNNYLKELNLHNGVQTIGFGAFQGCENVESLTLPSGLTYISSGMFRNMSSLRSITIPSSVWGMGEYAFYGCTSLESVVLPEGLNSVGGQTFYGCTSLKSVKIPSSLADITNGMFYKCSALKNVKISNGTTRISHSAFSGCTSLRTLDIPASVTGIFSFAFNGCKLDAIVIRGTLQHPHNSMFSGLDTSTPVYTQSSQVGTLQAIYDGSVYPLENHNQSVDVLSVPQAETSNGIIYDLDGRHVNNAKTGVHILNGKKVLLK